MTYKPQARIRLTIDIPITDIVTTPAELPTAAEVTEWLTDEYVTPCGLIADFDQNAHATLEVHWQHGKTVKEWWPGAGWTDPVKVTCGTGRQHPPEPTAAEWAAHDLEPDETGALRARRDQIKEQT